MDVTEEERGKCRRLLKHSTQALLQHKFNNFAPKKKKKKKTVSHIKIKIHSSGGGQWPMAILMISKYTVISC